MFRLAKVTPVRRYHTIIMLGVLKVSFGGYSIARRRRFPRKREVFFHHLLCIATDRGAIVPF
jgi:hypothetical protein